MDVSILVCSHGDESWAARARERAVPSAEHQQPLQVVVEHDPGATLAEVRNQAAARARGDWLCFLDADDELAPGYLDAMRVTAERCYVAGAHSPVLLVPAVSYVFGGGASPPEIPNKGRWPQINECVIGTLVPAWLFRQVGGFREFEAYEDWDLWLRCAKAGAKLLYVPEAVYVAHVRPGSRNETSRTDVYRQIWEEYVA